uniref:Biogenic amine-like GPCR n=1 Tax=Tripedalia cystophora TaxID=6141 RepID=A0A481ZMR9_TRICY|nr:biogenic amine-like GPCR [Tripedalia cystophora]
MKRIIPSQMETNFSLIHGIENRTRTCPSLYAKYLYPAMSALVLIWIPVCAVGNLIVLFSISRKRSLRTQANFLLMNVAIADLLVTFFLQPIDYMYYANFPIYPHSVGTTLVWNAAFYSLLTASVYSLAVLSLERLLAIRCPLRYNVLITRKGLFMILMSIWLYSSATFITVYTVQKKPKPGKFDYLVPDGFYGGLITVNFLLPLAFMMAAYFYIFKVARRHRRQISFLRLQINKVNVQDQSNDDLKRCKLSQSNTSDHGHDKDASSPCPDAELDFRKLSRVTLTKELQRTPKSTTGIFRASYPKIKRPSRVMFSLTKELKTARLFAVVMLCFILFWSPFLIYQFLFITDSIIFTCEIEFGDQVVSWITYLNSGVNAFVYGAMSREFRKSYKNLLLFMFCRCKRCLFKV